MDTEMTTLTAAPAMATDIIEPENLSRMMASFCPTVLLQRNPHETQTSADDSVFRYSPIADHAGHLLRATSCKVPDRRRSTRKTSGGSRNSRHKAAVGCVENGAPTEALIIQRVKS